MFSMLDEEFENRCGKHIHARPFTKEALLYREIFEKNGLTTCLFCVAGHVKETSGDVYPGSKMKEMIWFGGKKK